MADEETKFNDSLSYSQESNDDGSITATITLNDNHNQKEKKLKAEIRRKAALANKRLSRLEKNGLTNLSAYRNWIDYRGGVKFSVKGKTHNQLVAELARVDSFINSKTSTVRGANKVLKEIANTNHISYKRIGELNTKLSNFFELYSKAKQYLENTADVANSIGSNFIMETISNYVKKEDIDLETGMTEYDGVIESITDLLTEQYDEQVDNEIFDSFENLIDDL